MKRTALPLDQIQVIDRQRIDLGEMDELIASIKKYGLIQPIVINQDNRLIAGGRRFVAHQRMGLPTIDVVYRETLTLDELHELELEENIQRKDMTWQEECLNIAKVHNLKERRAAMDSQSWGQQRTGAMLGISVGHINYVLRIAEKLTEELVDGKPKEGARFWPLESLAEAWRLILRDRQDALNAALAKEQQQASAAGVDEQKEQLIVEQVLQAQESADALALERERYYSNPHNPPGSFEEYWKEKQETAKKIQNTVYLSNRFFNVDAIQFMNSRPKTFDHVITDIPYGIDMSNLAQENTGIGDIDTVSELHDVNYNYQLIKDFFPAAYSCTKDAGFVITWCDQMLWQFMYDCATKAGFAVQRWPITWFKTSQCINQSAQYNTTKDTEIAIVCRKKGSTIVNQPGTSVISAPRDELCKSLGHPFAKPFAVWEFLIDSFTFQGQTILEPFAGRGSGVISMLRTQRNVFATELDTAHFNALLENIKVVHYLQLNPEFEFK